MNSQSKQWNEHISLIQNSMKCQKKYILKNTNQQQPWDMRKQIGPGIRSAKSHGHSEKHSAQNSSAESRDTGVGGGQGNHRRNSQGTCRWNSCFSQHAPSSVLQWNSKGYQPKTEVRSMGTELSEATWSWKVWKSSHTEDPKCQYSLP